jgi:purine-binding chemotaxis protein CheW
MVDLVKVRKKAKEKKGQEEQAAASVAPPEAPRAEPRVEAAPPVLEETRKPAAKKSGERSERGLEKLEEFRATANQLQQQAIAAGHETVSSTEFLELLLFRIAGEQYALPIERIIEIIPPRTATRVPNADETVLGIISLRGTIVSILDIRRKLGHPPLQSTGEDSRIIVVESSGETAGFLVDRVSRVVRVEPSKIESHPVASSVEQSEFIRGVFQHAQKLSILLDLETLLRF